MFALTWIVWGGVLSCTQLARVVTLTICSWYFLVSGNYILSNNSTVYAAHYGDLGLCLYCLMQTVQYWYRCAVDLGDGWLADLITHQNCGACWRRHCQSLHCQTCSRSRQRKHYIIPQPSVLTTLSVCLSLSLCYYVLMYLHESRLLAV